MKKSIVAFTLACLLGAGTASAEKRLVTVGGPVTEITFALGAGDDIVAVDQSSLYPKKATQLPQVGYVGALGAEGVLSVNPSMILASSRIGPPAVVDQLEQSGIPMTVVENPHDVDTLKAALEKLGEVLDRKEKAAEIWNDVAAKIEKAQSYADKTGTPRVVFLMGNSGLPMAAGKGTQGSGIIALAGGKNLFDGHTSYKPVSEEALIEADPDFVLVATHGGLQGDPREALRDLGLANLAAKEDVNVKMLDMGYYLSFGPRTGDAALELAKIFAGEQSDDTDSE